MSAHEVTTRLTQFLRRGRDTFDIAFTDSAGTAVTLTYNRRLRCELRQGMAKASWAIAADGKSVVLTNADADAAPLAAFVALRAEVAEDVAARLTSWAVDSPTGANHSIQ